MNKCAIVANGSHENLEEFLFYFQECDIIIGVDGGLNALSKIGIEPTVILGDFDSVHGQVLESYQNKGIPSISFPKRKDATDSELAIDYAIEQNLSTLYLFGMTGKRLDHGLTNIHMLRKIPKSIKACILDAHNEIYYGNQNFELEGYIGKNLSIIPMTDEVKGLNTKGLDYPLKNETLYYNQSRGVSNVIVQEKVQISATSGEFFIIISKD